MEWRDKPKQTSRSRWSITRRVRTSSRLALQFGMGKRETKRRGEGHGTVLRESTGENDKGWLEENSVGGPCILCMTARRPRYLDQRSHPPRQTSMEHQNQRALVPGTAGASQGRSQAVLLLLAVQRPHTTRHSEPCTTHCPCGWQSGHWQQALAASGGGTANSP